MKITSFPLSAAFNIHATSLSIWPITLLIILVILENEYKRMIKVGNKNFILRLKWLAVIGIIGAATYPIIISPMVNSTSYKELQKISRKEIDQEKIQPGNMKVWSDPFDRKK